MIELEEEIRIEASPESVFEYIADPPNHLKFTPSLMDISDVGKNEVGKQGEYAFKMIGVSLEGRFADTEFDRPHRRAYELDGEDHAGSVTWIIEEANGGSHVTYRATMDLPGPEIIDALTDRVGKRILRKEAESTLENLKTLLEESGGGVSDEP